MCHAGQRVVVGHLATRCSPPMPSPVRTVARHAGSTRSSAHGAHKVALSRAGQGGGGRDPPRSVATLRAPRLDRSHWQQTQAVVDEAFKGRRQKVSAPPRPKAGQGHFIDLYVTHLTHRTVTGRNLPGVIPGTDEGLKTGEQATRAGQRGVPSGRSGHVRGGIRRVQLPVRRHHQLQAIWTSSALGMMSTPGMPDVWRDGPSSPSAPMHRLDPGSSPWSLLLVRASDRPIKSVQQLRAPHQLARVPFTRPPAECRGAGCRRRGRDRWGEDPVPFRASVSSAHAAAAHRHPVLPGDVSPGDPICTTVPWLPAVHPDLHRLVCVLSSSVVTVLTFVHAMLFQDFRWGAVPSPILPPSSSGPSPPPLSCSGAAAVPVAGSACLHLQELINEGARKLKVRC